MIETKIVNETNKYVKYETLYNGKAVGLPSKAKKLLCIGGPFAGQHKANMQLDSKEYHAFNCAGTRNDHSQIFVHTSLLTTYP